MLRGIINSFIILMITLIGYVDAKDNFLILKIGPIWPKELKSSEKPTAWDASVHSGLSVDRKIAIGGGIDFLWNIYKKETPVAGSNNTYRLEKVERTIMFPVSGYIAIDPIPDYIVHPCVSTQLGLNIMYYSTKEDSTEVDGPDDRNLIDENGWYMGFYMKFAADAIYNIGEKSGLFAGIEFQFSNPKKINKEQGDLFTKRNMNSFGIRMGLRLIY